MNSYLTIQGRTTAETEEKKSRFITHLCHVETEEEALAFLEEIRELHRMARHNVYAYIIRGSNTSERIRYSDDGEPQKTAGLPTLDVLKHAGLSDVIAVTTRYFGGTLLGTGGLVRAYTQTAQKAIQEATLVTISQCIDISIQLPYSLYDQTSRALEDFGAKIIDTAYTDSVEITCRILDGTQDKLLAKLNELFRGENNVRLSDPFDAVF